MEVHAFSVSATLLLMLPLLLAQHQSPCSLWRPVPIPVQQTATKQPLVATFPPVFCLGLHTHISQPLQGLSHWC